MFTFNKVLPAIALAIALFPLVAQAQTAPQPAYNGNQVVVQSGPANQAYPAAIGG